MDVLQAVAFIVFGVVVGTYGSLVGVGGGFLIVPMLLLVYGADHQSAAGTSLAVVFLGAISSNIAYIKQKLVDFRTGWRFALAALPGSLAGPFVGIWLAAAVFNVLFGLMLVFVAVYLLFRSEPRPLAPPADSGATGTNNNGRASRRIVDARGVVHSYSLNERLGMLISLGVGFLSSLTGIGGGIIHVPVLVHLFRFPTHVAVATSLFILAITSAFGAASHLWLGHVMLLPALTLGFGVLVGAQLGGAISYRLQGRWLIRLLAIALFAVGVRLLLSAR